MSSELVQRSPEDIRRGAELIEAVQKGRIDVVKHLLENTCVDVNACVDGRTVLDAAAEVGDSDIVRLLLAHGADVGLSGEGGRAALDVATERGHTEVVPLLLEKGAGAKACRGRRTVLHTAALEGHTDIVRLLLEKGAKVNAQDAKGYTALIYAAAEGNGALVHLLLENGANPRIRNRDGDDALAAALRGKFFDIITELGERLPASSKRRRGGPHQSARARQLTHADPQIEWVAAPAGNFRFRERQYSIENSLLFSKVPITVRQFATMVEETGYRTIAETTYKSRVKYAKEYFEKPPALLTWQRPGFVQGDDHPVVCMARADVIAFCTWLSTCLGGDIRLPSMDEWIWGCGVECFNLESEAVSKLGWFMENSSGRTQPVAQKSPNLWGLYDMLGNVWELCSDVRMPEGSEDLYPLDGFLGDFERQVACGGCYDSEPRFLLGGLFAGRDDPRVGFRVVVAC